MAAVAAGACSSEHVRAGGKHTLPATLRDAAVTGGGKSASSSFAVLDDVASQPRSSTRQTTTDADAMLHGPLPGSQIPPRLASQPAAGGTLGRITKGGAQASAGCTDGRADAPPPFPGSGLRGAQSCRRSRDALSSFGADGCAGRHSRAPGRKRPVKRGADAQKRSSGSRGQRNALPRREIRQRQLNVKAINMAGLSEDKYNLMLDDVVPGTDVLFASELGNSKGEAVYPALAAASGGSFITSDPPPPSDPAAGAGIYLSARAKDNILGLPGANGPRICFVRIKMGIANQALFCVAFYCRYWNWGAKKGVPAGQAFLEDMVLLQETLEQAPAMLELDDVPKHQWKRKHVSDRTREALRARQRAVDSGARDRPGSDTAFASTTTNCSKNSLSACAGPSIRKA